MMTKRLVMLFLCIAMLVTMIPVLPVVASEVAYDDINDIMGKEVAAVSGLDFQFANNFDSSMDYVTTPEGASYGENGLDLTNVTAEASNASWRYKPVNGWALFEHGDAVYFRAKVNAGGCLNFQFFQPEANEEMYRFYMNIYDTKFTVSNYVGSPAGNFTFTPGCDWADYLVKKNDDGGFAVYIKAVSTQNMWRHYLTVPGGEWKSAGGNTIGISFIGAHADNENTGGYVKHLAVLDDFPVNTEQIGAIYIEDFVDLPTYRNQTIVSGAINNGNLVLTGGSTPASFTLNSSEIPCGGYALFQIKSDSSPVVAFHDGSQSFSYHPISEEYGSNHSDRYYQWQVIHNTDGTFSGLYMEEGEEMWHSGFSNLSDSTSAEKFISFEVGLREDGISPGTLYLDWLEIYAPGIQDDVIMTDGAGGEILDSCAGAKYMDSVSIVVKPDLEKDRTLVVGVYGENLALADSFVQELPAGKKASMVVCDLTRKTNNVRKIRTFLWDGFQGMVPVSLTSSIKGNVSSWYDDWVLSKNASTENDQIVLNPSDESAYAVFESEIFTEFDIAWTMTVNQFAGQETVLILSESQSISLLVEEDGVSYESTSGVVKFPWIINTSEHTYRIFGTGDSALLYIDRYFVGELCNLPINTESTGMKFQNAGESKIRIGKVYFEAFSETNIPSQGFYDEFKNDDCGWVLEDVEFNTGINKQFWTIGDDYIRVDDEHIALDYTTYCVSYGHKAITEIGDEFVVQARMSFPSFGTRSFLLMYVGGRCFGLDMREKFFSIRHLIDNSNIAATASDELFLNDSEYHLITIESYNQKRNVRVYLDGVLILNDETESYSGGWTDQIRFMADGGWYEPASMQIDYIKYIPKYYDFELTSPADYSEHYVGDDVILSAEKEADFYLNGVRVASGTTATIGNLPAGSYEVVAKNGIESSEPIQFMIKENIDANLQVVQSGTTLVGFLTDRVGFDSVASIVYLLDGKKIAESTSGSDSVEIKDITPEKHILEAVCYDSSGVELGRMSRDVSAMLTDATVSYSNEISYSATASGSLEVKNGCHHLQIIHKSTGIQYLAEDGLKSYSEGGLGNFTVLTDGPIAEVYKNGQFIMSYVMPKTSEIGISATGSIYNQKITVPEERKNFFSARNLNVQSTAYELADLSYNHNLDFVANFSDEAHLTLNDGYYRNDITIQDGKLFVWTADRNNSLPKLSQVATLTEEDVYYRVETSAGMSRLFADGKWITTFRNAIVSGRNGTLAVNVSSGDGLSYLSVNSNADLYFYSDSFDGSGAFDSVDYWTALSGTITVNDELKSLLIQSESDEARTEISAYVGNATFSADVTVNEGTQSVWMYGNHCVTDTFTKAGYNFATNQYELINVVNGEDVVLTRKAGTFPVGTPVPMSLSVHEAPDGRRVVLSVNGEEILSTTEGVSSRGTMGFAVSQGSILVDNVSFRGDAKPILDVCMTPIAGAPNALDMIETDERTYLVSQNVNGYYTTNGGETWENFTPSANAGFGPNGYGGVTKNMVQLQNGEIVSIHRNAPASWIDEYGQRKVVYQAYVSTDGGQGMTWCKPGNANFPGNGSQDVAAVGRDATVNRITQGPSGRIYYVSGEGNSEDYGDAIIWMSDDNGRNWFESSTKISALNVGYVIAEAVVIETSSSTRLYFRTDKGQLCYFESYDQGITWDLTLHTTPFISSMTCFGIEADPEDPDTLYIAWGYDNINVFARAQFPRNRWSVAKSTDGGDSWEMLGTVHENNSSNTQSMNMSINVSKDYIYVNGASSDVYQVGDDSKVNRVIALPKDKQRTSLRWEQVHLKNQDIIENTVVFSDVQEDLTMAVNYLDGTVLLRRQRVPNVSKDGFISLAVAASFIGASSVAEIEGGSLEFVIGEQKVTIDECVLKNLDGEKYIELSSFAEKTGLNIFDDNGIKIVTVEDSLSLRQSSSVRYALDLFSNIP